MNFDGVYNYYEHMVYETVLRALKEKNIASSINTAEDIACLALNQLPPRYVRHSVDTAFYTSTSERTQMDKAVKYAVNQALEQVLKNPGRLDPDN